MSVTNLEYFCNEETISIPNNTTQTIKSQIKPEKDPNRFYNYIYLDPRKPGKYCYEGLNFSLLYEPFYVGKGEGKRKYEHIRESTWGREKNTYKLNKIKKIIELEYNIKSFIFQPTLNLTNECASGIEINYIKTIGRNDFKLGPLTNLTNGGEGCNGWSIERKQKYTAKYKNISFEEKYGEERGKIIKKKLTDQNYTRVRTKEQFEKKSATIKASKQFVEEKNPNAKDVTLINHNTGEILNLRGIFAKYCKNHHYNYETMLRYKNKGEITLTIITEDYDPKYKINQLCYARIKRYIGLELIM